MTHYPFVTQAEIDDLLRRAGLPLDEKVTEPPPPFGAAGFDLYQDFIDPRAYFRPALTVSPALLSQPLY
jgi:hypothetical protein